MIPFAVATIRERCDRCHVARALVEVEISTGHCIVLCRHDFRRIEPTLPPTYRIRRDDRGLLERTFA